MLRLLQGATPEAQQTAGYADTLREILQQPATWQDTFDLLRNQAAQAQLAKALDPHPAHIVLTGSGSSIYIGECLAPVLQAGLGVPVQAIAAGTLLTHGRSVLPPGPGLLISLARSGDSPESGGVVNMLLEHAPAWRHLVITCNANGKLATHYRDEPRVTVLVLDERTNDRSLVMTSSFTNLLLGGTALLQGTRDALAASAVETAGANAQRIFDAHADDIAMLAQRDFRSAVYLGSGGMFGAAREGALKMLEMTGGQVVTMAETFLGLRHGPMSFVHPHTVIVALLSPDPAVRNYECDVLRELSRKRLGMGKLVIGDDVPADVLGLQDVAITTSAAISGGDVASMLTGVVTGQLLAFFRCLQLGCKPDTPSEGVLTRVVEDFAIHGAKP
ncbi:SIS domain-containing protein [Dyella caseinilytica]|uniref:Tagatose-6-phosphate ketose isomerase n=1 Tax=Dyella caseinilytica TaxID=1849581 RepID=A0ABX7GX83_9GAMM|nr:tagatose-6-phosphate ketose isomerase [Dyella caseinilytica]QRN54884.1 tagatose-6-phosphate ketose isomerase [Dyella caseinilytica]GFZ97668.1 tagatose-6-phosphate ketose isomerase [Dyella caseinilytica]